MLENPWHGGQPAKRSSRPLFSRSFRRTSATDTRRMSLFQSLTIGWFSLYAAAAVSPSSIAPMTRNPALLKPSVRPPHPAKRSIALVRRCTAFGGLASLAIQVRWSTFRILPRPDRSRLILSNQPLLGFPRRPGPRVVATGGGAYAQTLARVRITH